MGKTEVINFKEFMNGSWKEPKPKPIKAYSIIYINPMAFIDPTVCIVGGVILSIAVLEKYLQRKEHYAALEKIQSIMYFVLPTAGIGGVIYFLLTNPMMRWL
jgi:prolipoprotein diacylglyceryltransferase